MEISVIMPIYNAAKHLTISIEGILNQSFTDFELILINDGSTDDSASICKEYSNKDRRIIFIDKPNEGAGPTRNCGIKESSGKYIYFPDSDDIFDRDLLKISYEKAEEYHADLVVFAINRKIINSKNKKIENEIITTQKSMIIEGKAQFEEEFAELYYDGTLFTGPCNKLFKRDIIIKNNVLFPDLRRGQDEIFNFDYYKYINRVIIIPNILYTYLEYDRLAYWKKYKLNNFETTTITYHKKIWELFKNFDKLNEVNVKHLNNSFLSSMESAFYQCNNPYLKLKKEMKIDYIKKIIENKYVQERICNLSDIDESYSRYLTLIKEKSYKEILTLTTNSYIKDEFIGYLKNKIPALLTFAIYVKKTLRKVGVLK